MFLIPYFIESNPNWTKLSLFLCEGGRSVWSVDTMTDKEIRGLLKENGFPTVSLEHIGNTVYASTDRSKLKMSDFYQWDEINPKAAEQDVWRTLPIPLALWSCPVFKEHFWANAGLPCSIHDILGF